MIKLSDSEKNKKDINQVEIRLDEADYVAKTTTERYSSDEVYERARERIKRNENNNVIGNSIW